MCAQAIKVPDVSIGFLLEGRRSAYELPKYERCLTTCAMLKELVGTRSVNADYY